MSLPGGLAPLAVQAELVSPAPGSLMSGGALPVIFMETGELHSPARFQVRSDGATMWLAQDAIWMTVIGETPAAASQNLAADGLESPGREPREGVNLKITFPGANPHPLLVPFGRLDTKISRFVGNRPENWQTNVPAWGGVRYVELYPGVDLEILGQSGRLTQRLICKSRCPDSLQSVQVAVEGANAMELMKSHLRLSTSVGEVQWTLFQVAGVERAQLPAPSLAGTEVTHPFAVGSLLALDGEAGLIWSTFVGGSNSEFQSIVVLDASGNPVVATCTYSPDYPTTVGAFDTSLDGNKEVVVFKLSADGNSLLFATYVGGKAQEELEDMVQDQMGNLVVTGTTDSPDFPSTPGAYDTVPDHVSYYNSDAYVFKLAADGGSLLFSTFVGGTDLDGARSLALDSEDNVVVVGNTHSTNFPTTDGAYSQTYSGEGIGCWGCGDAFALKLSADGSSLLWSTFIGGSQDESGWRVALDEAANVFILGWTTSSDFPTTAGVFDETFNGYCDIFILKLSADGSVLDYSTYVGGTGRDDAWLAEVVLDEAGNLIATGFTESTDFPTTPGAFDTIHDGISDAFVLKLSADASGLVYSTFIGGGDSDSGRSLALDQAGNLVIVGQTASADFPTTDDAYDATHNGGKDAYVAMLAADGSSLLYSTYIGGEGRELADSVTLDAVGNPVISGYTESSDFPATSAAYDSFHNGGYDTFVLKLPATNRLPRLAISQPLIAVDEGQIASNSGTVTDADGDTVTLTASAGEVTDLGDGTWSWSLATTDGLSESLLVTIYADDGKGKIAESSFELIVHNVAPSIDAISAAIEPVSINEQPVTVEVFFSDPGTGDTHDVTWNWGDGTSETQSDMTSPAAQSHSYGEAGVYAVELAVTDDDRGSAIERYEFIVVYDPDGAFVIGGGWIESPVGAYSPAPSLSGIASFGFVSKYKKGATVPTGNTEFPFHAGSLNFRSTSYAWLIVTGSDYARYKGFGIINGQLAPDGEPYKFLLWAGDDDPDTFRIKIWWDDGETETVVYDNGMDQTIGGGSIVIHTRR